jgi:hypothetical protein
MDRERIVKILSDIDRYTSDLESLGIRTPDDMAKRKNTIQLP